VRRFDVEHDIKTFKAKLGWTTPRVRHPEQSDLWTWLILAAYTQLRLARGVVADQPLPWERPLPIQKMTPTRVLRNFASLLPALGTPAAAPKPCGSSPGRPKGSLSGPARRYPAVKKAEGRLNLGDGRFTSLTTLLVPVALRFRVKRQAEMRVKVRGRPRKSSKLPVTGSRSWTPATWPLPPAREATSHLHSRLILPQG